MPGLTADTRTISLETSLHRVVETIQESLRKDIYSFWECYPSILENLAFKG